MSLHPKIQRAPDGQPFMVIRPSTEDGKKVALAVASHALQTQNQELLANPPADDYVFVGYLAPGGELVDADGQHVGTIEPGDSVVSDSPEDKGANRQQRRAIEANKRRKWPRGPKPLRPRSR